MANWAINSESVGSENAVIKSDKLKLPKTIKENDRVLLFRKRNEEVSFLQTTTVEYIKTLSNPEVGKEVVAIQLRTPTDLQESTSLSALTFSLELITRFDSPSKHFNIPIRKISDNDFDTIEKQNVFWSRSAFGFYVNALPKDRFFEFVQFVATSDPDFLIDSPRFLSLWPLLRNWIQDEYFDAVYYATAIREAVARISKAGTLVPFDLISVSMKDVGRTSSGLLSKLVSDLESFYLSTNIVQPNVPNTINQSKTTESVFDQVDTMIKENLSSERVFEKAFMRKKWPITRKIKI